MARVTRLELATSGVTGRRSNQLSYHSAAQADKIITLGKKDTLQTTKMLVSQLQDIKSANKVKKTLSKRYSNRKGGYTRIIKAGFRYGDNAPMAIIEFVDRDVEAKRVDKKKKDTSKEAPKTEENKQATA